MTYYNNKIQEGVKVHSAIARERYEDPRIIGTFLYGSQNYGTDTIDSDIDTKTLIFPKVEDIVTLKEPVSKIITDADLQHVEIKDIRLYCKEMLKQGMNFLEILFTPYRELNPKYTQLWWNIENHREEFAHYAPERVAKTTYGYAMRSYKALLTNTTLPKHLSNIVRLEEFLERYISGESYSKCLKSQKVEYLRELKSGSFDFSKATAIASAAITHIKEMADDTAALNSVKCYKEEVDRFLPQLLLALFTIYLEGERK